MEPEQPEHEEEVEGPGPAGRGGCVGLLLEVGGWIFSTLLITVGAFLLVFGVLDFSPEARLRTIVLLVLIPVAIYALIRIGRSILDELRGE